MVIKTVIYSLREDDFANFERDVVVDRDIYFKYLYKKEFNKMFNPTECLLDSNYKSFYNRFNKDWLENKIDERSICESDDFEAFLKEQFRDEFEEIYYNFSDDDDYEDDDDPDGWWNDLDYDEKRTIMKDYR